MLMMMRSDDTYTPTEGCSAEELLKCLTADDYDACVAACGNEGQQEDEPEEVKAGTLTVSMGDALADGTQIPNAGIVSFGTVKFAASSDDVNLKSVTIKKQGLVKTMANTKVWFEENGNRVSAKVSFNSDGEAIVSFAPAYTVKANKTAKFDLYVDLTNAGLGAGTDLSFASINVDSSAETNKGSFSTPTLRTANYAVADVQIFDTAATYSEATCTPGQETAGWTDDVRTHVAANCTTPATNFTAGTAVAPVAPIKSTATNNGWQLAEFRIDNLSSTEDVLVRSIQLRQEGTADLENISDIVLERNSEVISKKYTIDGKYVTILLDNDKIEKGNNAVYTLRAKVNTVDAGDNYEFYLKNAEDLNVVEATTEFRASLVSSNFGLAATANTYGTTLTARYTVEGGDVTFARDESLDLDQTVSAGSEVVLMQGTITTKESVTFENPQLSIATLGGGAAKLSDMFTTLYLKIGSSVFTYTAGNEGALSPLNFDGTAVVNGKVNVKVYGTLKNTTAGMSIKLDSMDLATFTTAGSVYYANEVNVLPTASIGTIAGNSVTVEGSVLSMTRTDGLGTLGNISVGDGNTIYKANITSQSTKGAKVTSVKFNILLANSDLDQASTLTLYVNGKAVATRNLPAITANTNVTFNGLNFTVDKNTPAEIEVRANIKEGTTAGTFIKLEKTTAGDGISYVDLANNRTQGVDTIDGAQLAIVAPAGKISVDADAVDAKLLSKGATDQKVATLKIESTEGKLRLYNLTLTIPSTNVSNVRLANASGEVVATATSFATNTATFTNIANTEFIEKDETTSYDVLVDVNSNITAGNLNVTLAAAQLRNNNGGNATTTLVAGSLVSNTHRVTDGSIVVTQTSDKQGTSINNDTLTFTVTANGADAVIDYSELIKNTNLKLVQAGLTPGAVEISKNGTAITDDLTVSKGSTVTLSIAYPSAVLAGGATSFDWNLTMVDLPLVKIGTDTGITSVKSFKNVGSFPFIARK